MYRDLVVKSSLSNYKAEFVHSVKDSLLQYIQSETSFFVVDEKVFQFYENDLAALKHVGNLIVVQANEKNKTLEKCRDIIKILVEKKVRKNFTLVAIGGGITQDIVAFISSILYRGISWVFYPTTLLAQGDSCIGSKTSINLGEYKNLVGGFYPPAKIHIWPNFLDSLTTSEIKSGIGEMLHFYFYAGSSLASEIMDEYEELIKNRSKLLRYILESLKIKKSVIELDEFDREIRNLFNYGHTFGHAIESLTNYAVPHGQAVTMGMDIANYISYKQDRLAENDFLWMKSVLSKNMPDFILEKKHLPNYIDALSKDKKNIGKNLTCILAKGLGRLEKITMPMDEDFCEIILDYFKEKDAQIKDFVH